MVIQVGDAIRLAELAWDIWSYGWGVENNAGENYRAFGAEVRTLHTSLRRLDEAVFRAQSSPTVYGARGDDVLIGDRLSLLEIIGDYQGTLRACRQLVDDNRRYSGTTGPMRNIEWNTNVMSQVTYLRDRLQMHNMRVQQVLGPFQIDLITNLHHSLNQRLTGIHTDIISIGRDLRMLISQHHPDVAREIAQREEEESRPVPIPEEWAVALESMCYLPELRRPVTVQEMVDCVLLHIEQSRMLNGSPNSLISLINCQFLMNRISCSCELTSATPLSHWPSFISALQENLSQQYSRQEPELAHLDLSGLDPKAYNIWSIMPVQKALPTEDPTADYNYLLDAPLAAPDGTTFKRLRLFKRIGSEHLHRIIEDSSPGDQTISNVPQVVDFDIRRATVTPIYADPVSPGSDDPPLEILLEENSKRYMYTFIDIKDLLYFQQAITGYEVADSWVESRATAAFVRHERKDHFELATIQIWIPTVAEALSTVGTQNDGRRTSSTSTLSAPSTFSTSTASSSGSDDTIAVNLTRTATITGPGVMRRHPSPPLLVLFTRGMKLPGRSTMFIKLDGDVNPNPARCDCCIYRDCLTTTLERKRGTVSALDAFRLENSWDLLSISKRMPAWPGLLRTSFLFPTVEARHRMAGSPCGCGIRRERDVNACLRNNHQGLLGLANIQYRRLMVLWQDHGDGRRDMRR